MPRRIKACCLGLAYLALLLGCLGNVDAQEQASEVPTPSGVKLALLIKSTLIALTQANKTGNYTVLRELGTPSFQQQFSSADLAESFKDLRSRKLDLSPTILERPNLIEDVSISANGVMLLYGYMPTQPLSVQFKIYFRYLDQNWLLAGLAVDTIEFDKIKTVEDGASDAGDAESYSASKQLRQTKAAPSTTQDSAPASHSVSGQEEPKRGFVPRAAYIPTPLRRPEPSSEWAAQPQAIEKKSENEPRSDTDGSIWTLWGN